MKTHAGISFISVWTQRPCGSSPFSKAEQVLAIMISSRHGEHTGDTHQFLGLHQSVTDLGPGLLPWS